MFRLRKQVFIVMLGFSGSLATIIRYNTTLQK